MADEDSFGDDSFGDTGRGGAGDDDFDDSFDDGAFGGGPGDENPMTQVRRRSSVALSYYSSAARMHCVTAPLASPVRSRRWCRTSRTTRRWR